jgi:LmbE family N-acetylglucosaminyl deacetylase
VYDFLRALPVTLNKETEIPCGLNIFVLAPHPDDFDAVGVTLKYFSKRGADIRLAVATSGSSGVEDSFCFPPTGENKGLAREKEQSDSCCFFGLPEKAFSFSRLPEDEEGHPLDSRENASRIAENLTLEKPDIVFLPHGNDTNAGHRRIFRFFREAVISVGLKLVAFYNRDPKTIEMRNDVYMTFGENEALWKAELLKFHKSQHVRNLNTRGIGFDERILEQNRFYAKEYLDGKVSYAEVFEIEIFN